MVNDVSACQSNFNLTPLKDAGSVFDQFHVMQKFNVNTIKEVDVFLFATRHDSNACKTVIGTALSQIVRDRNHLIIFVEGTSKTGELIEERDFLLEHLSIDPSLSINIRFFSWDLKTDEGHRLFTNDWVTEFNRLTEALKPLEELYLEVEAELKTLFSALEDTLPQKGCGQEGRGELIYLMSVHRLLVEKKTEIANQLKETVALATDMQRKAFPQRTESTVSALQSIQVDGTTAFAFVGGASHFCQENPDDPVYDLTPLSQELSHHRSMILLPKAYTQPI